MGAVYKNTRLFSLFVAHQRKIIYESKIILKNPFLKFSSPDSFPRSSLIWFADKNFTEKVLIELESFFFIFARSIALWNVFSLQFIWTSFYLSFCCCLLCKSTNRWNDLENGKLKTLNGKLFTTFRFLFRFHGSSIAMWFMELKNMTTSRKRVGKWSDLCFKKNGFPQLPFHRKYFFIAAFVKILKKWQNCEQKTKSSDLIKID